MPSLPVCSDGASLNGWPVEVGNLWTCDNLAVSSLVPVTDWVSLIDATFDVPICEGSIYAETGLLRCSGVWTYAPSSELFGGESVSAAGQTAFCEGTGSFSEPVDPGYNAVSCSTSWAVLDLDDVHALVHAVSLESLAVGDVWLLLFAVALAGLWALGFRTGLAR